MEIRNIAYLLYSPEEDYYADPVFYHLENKLKRTLWTSSEPLVSLIAVRPMRSITARRETRNYIA